MSRKGWVFLTNVASEMEADIVLGLLDNEGIPGQKAYPGAGNLKATFGLINGVDIFVPADQVLVAKEILRAENEELLPSEPKE